MSHRFLQSFDFCIRSTLATHRRPTHIQEQDVLQLALLANKEPILLDAAAYFEARGQRIICFDQS